MPTRNTSKWIGPTTGLSDWDVTANWSGGALPGTNSTVVIGNGGDPYQIAINSSSPHNILGLDLGDSGDGHVTLYDYQSLVVFGNTVLQGANLDLGTGGVAALGGITTLDASSGIADLGALTIGALTGSGTVGVDYGTLFAGSVSGTGTITIADGALAEIGAAASGTIKFADGYADQLLLDNPGATLGAAVAGFGGSNSIDVASLSFSSSYTADWNGTGLDIKDGAAVVFSISSINNPGAFVLENDGSGGTEIVTCYVAGTRILTDRGEVAVENLREGDGVAVCIGDATESRPVRWVGQRQISLHSHPKPELVLPVRILKDALAIGVPHRDLLVSPDHAIFVDGVLIAARQLLNGMTIRQETGWRSVHYFHIELASHEILLAEGLPAESYLDTGNRGFFANSDAPPVLHPGMMKDRAVSACAAGVPFVVDEPTVRPIWLRLADRAAALGYRTAPVVATSDPDLRMLVNGLTVNPVQETDGRYVFIVPDRANEVRLVSRAVSPSDSAPWLDDRRALGVSVGRLVLRSAAGVQDIPVDHPGLADGWWSTERSGSTMRRWTNGNALLRLPATHGPVMLEVHSAGTLSYPLVAARAAGEDERKAA